MTEPTKVNVLMSFQVNLGNYNLLKVQLGVEDYVRDGETTDKATDRVYDFVEQKMIAKVEQTKAEIEAHKS